MASSKKKSPASGGTAPQKAKRVPIADIPEVQEFMDLKQEIEALKAANPDVFMLLADLVDRYNTALEAASNKVRSLQVTCGPFDNYATTTRFNIDKMHDELGEDMFLACGGSSNLVRQYKADTHVIEAAIASGKIPPSCIDEFRTITLSYHTPTKLNV
jgi:hypothetical protein